GKSTFLLAVNYAITGRVPEPEKDFISLEDYYERSEDFSRSFFEGRIGERDHDRAEVQVELRVGNWRARIRRGMFEPGVLRELRVGENGSPLKKLDGSPAELQ